MSKHAANHVCIDTAQMEVTYEIGCVHRKLFKNTDHQQMHKESFIINCNTLLHVSTLLGHLQGELFVIVTLRLHFIVEWNLSVTITKVLPEDYPAGSKHVGVCYN
jgi:hypothetical protein